MAAVTPGRGRDLAAGACLLPVSWWPGSACCRGRLGGRVFLPPSSWPPSSWRASSWPPRWTASWRARPLAAPSSAACVPSRSPAPARPLRARHPGRVAELDRPVGQVAHRGSPLTRCRAGLLSRRGLAALDAAAFLAAAEAFLVGCRSARARTVVSSSSSTASSRALRQHVEVAHRVPVGGQPEEHLAVVRRDPDGQQVARPERQHRIAGHQPLARRVQRSSAVPGTLVTSTSCWRRSTSLDTRTPSACRVVGAKPAMSDRVRASTARPVSLCAWVRVRHLVQPHQRVLLADRQRLQVRRDLTTQRGGLAVVLGDAHRHQSGQLAVRWATDSPAGQQPGPQRAGDRGQDDVVDGVVVLVP